MISIDPLSAFLSIVAIMVALYLGMTVRKKSKIYNSSISYESEPEVVLDSVTKGKVKSALEILKSTTDFWPSLVGADSSKSFRVNIRISTWDRVKSEINLLSSYKLLSYSKPSKLISKGGSPIVQIEFTIESKTLRLLVLEAEEFHA